jgi:hypothetical protein
MAHSWIATHKWIHAARSIIAAFHSDKSNEYPTIRHKMDTSGFEPIQAPDACDPGSTAGMSILLSIQVGLVVDAAVDRESVISICGTLRA